MTPRAKAAGKKSTKQDQSSAKTSRKPASTSKAKAAAKTPSRAASQTTTDHEEIREWAEARGGVPACVRGTGSKQDTGMIRIEFSAESKPKLQQIAWEDWFEKFDENKLALVYQDKTARGQPSRFNKIVKRD
jgi:hypothetical protein